MRIITVRGKVIGRNRCPSKLKEYEDICAYSIYDYICKYVVGYFRMDIV